MINHYTSHGLFLHAWGPILLNSYRNCQQALSVPHGPFWGPPSSSSPCLCPPPPLPAPLLLLQRASVRTQRTTAGRGDTQSE